MAGSRGEFKQDEAKDKLKKETVQLVKKLHAQVYKIFPGDIDFARERYNYSMYQPDLTPTQKFKILPHYMRNPNLSCSIGIVNGELQDIPLGFFKNESEELANTVALLRKYSDFLAAEKNKNTSSAQKVIQEIIEKIAILDPSLKITTPKNDKPESGSCRIM